MSAEQNRDTVGRLLENLDREAVGALVADNSVDHETSPGWAPSSQGFKAFLNSFLTAVPDLQAVVEEIVAEGDKVAVRLTFSGTARSEFLRIPSGRRFRVTGLGFFRVVGGKVVEHWGIMGRLELL